MIKERTERRSNSKRKERDRESQTEEKNKRSTRFFHNFSPKLAFLKKEEEEEGEQMRESKEKN